MNKINWNTRRTAVAEIKMQILNGDRFIPSLNMSFLSQVGRGVGVGGDGGGVLAEIKLYKYFRQN